MSKMTHSIPVVCGILIFLLTYSLAVLLLFSPDKLGRRRRWCALDYIWVPLGGLAGLSLVALWWRMQ